MGRLQDKVAVITGSTSGIGQATARLFAQEGAKVVVNGRRRDRGERIVAEIQAAGGTASYYYADVAQADQVHALVQYAVDTYGRLDILMNNAFSSPGRGGSVVETPEHVWDGVMDVSLKAIYVACKEAIPVMIAHGGGVILNTSSVHGILATRRGTACDTIKAGMINMTRQIAVDFGHQGIRCNAICPGLILVADDLEAYEREHPERVRQAEVIYPVGRPGYPLDVAYAALFLASDEASFITGHALVVDGGLIIQLQDALASLVETTLRERGGKW